jgi:hypothetical protein
MSARKIIILFVVLELAIIVIVLLSEGYSLTALQTITRFSGRLSLILFSAIFLLYNKPKTITIWLSDKYYLLFAIVHGIHLIELLAFVYLSKTQLIPYRVAGGFLAYAYIFLMPLFQHRHDAGRMSHRSYSILETVFVYYIWAIFFLTYLPRVQGKLPQGGGSFEEHVALLGWVSTLLGMKLAGLIQFKRTKTN